MHNIQALLTIAKGVQDFYELENYFPRGKFNSN